MAPRIVFLAPPPLAGYDRRRPPAEQPATVPAVFLDAMNVREAVFVQEQNVPLEAELDNDDARCCHWVLYGDADKDGLESKPLGTIRLVPYPQSPHPVSGGVYAADADGGYRLLGITSTTSASGGPPLYDAVDAGTAASLESGPRSTVFHDENESYVKLGRLAVLRDYRGHGLARDLVAAALEWMRQNGGYFENADDSQPPFRGLVCVHAQVQAAAFWQKMGFKIDSAMGEWWEEGMPHVGMFLRLDMDKTSA